MRRVKHTRSFIKLILKGLSIFIVMYIVLIIASLIITFFNREDIKSTNLSTGEAFKRAMSIINYKWTYETKNVDENIILPYYIGDKKEYIGIPYCYGGRISVDSSNIEEVSDFKDSLKKGYYPGNINTTLGYIKNTAGLDCSGFIAAVYNIKENISTTNMDKYFKEIKFNNIKPMDIINSKGKHVYIYLRHTDDGKGIIILESTSNGDKKYKDKTVVNFKSIKELKKDLDERNYIPMRYNGIKEDKKLPLFDANEYNNEERFSKDININDKVQGSIDYLEDVDFYNLSAQETVYINVSKLAKGQEIIIYNSKDEIKINKEGKYKLLALGNMYIKVYSSNGDLHEKDYVFDVFTK